MSLARVYSRALVGVEAPLVTVETHISNGLPALAIVGLPETAVRESKERVRSAILNARLDFPSRRVTVNLAPAELPKVGCRFDLAIALSILAASDQLPKERLEEYEFLGELALGGELRGVKGALPAALQVSKGGRKLVIPTANAREAGLVRKCRAFHASSLIQVLAFFAEGQALPACEHIEFADPPYPGPDLQSIKGQAQAKRALQIAAAGGHNLLLKGPPGTGKTLLASALPGILPCLSEHEALEVAAIHSLVKEGIDLSRFRVAPFRSPHHSASPVSLVGGGSRALPGEVSLAHHGVLFLDELPEFKGPALEVLREPIEAGVITVTRASHRVKYPASFQLVGAMNPCPCGYHLDPSGKCHCAPTRVNNYCQRISGPMLDRIDLIVDVPRLSHLELASLAPDKDDSKRIRTRVQVCRDLQYKRTGKLNSRLSGPELEHFCKLDEKGRALMQKAVNKLHLSGRGFHRTLKLARTLADLESLGEIRESHLLEALAYREFTPYAGTKL